MVWRSGLSELKPLLSAGDVVFCTDSGIMHMAAAVGTPVVAVFGPTSVEMFGPAGAMHTVLAAESMPCRPCYDTCIYDRPICYDAITADKAIRALTAVIKRETPAAAH